MVIPVEITWTTGQVVTAAQLNANLRDAVNFLLNPPSCELRQTVVQSIGGSGNTLLFDTEDLDNDGMHSTVTNTTRATSATTGRYAVSWASTWAANATGRKGGWLIVNGVNVNASSAVVPSSAATGTSVPGRSRNIFLNAGDYAEVFAYQESGGVVNTNAGTFDQSSFSLRYVGTT